MKYQELETKRLLLRKFESSDLDFIFRHFNDGFVSNYLYDNEPPQDLTEAGEILDWCMDLDSNHIRLFRGKYYDHNLWSYIVRKANLS